MINLNEIIILLNLLKNLVKKYKNKYKKTVKYYIITDII